ncbi:MAG: hypothetical protein CHACPFDD_01940 [Phycisphaerae bacterium]|nr:hypothetical protein [Phycisphaerae bacterium]
MKRRTRLSLAAVLLATCPPLASPQTKDTLLAPTSQPQRTNRLKDATSPYLQQHAHNPVDWYEWGPEALERARREDRPIFLSIGYSACHWCHVMAHESFEDNQTAQVLSAYFVSIKVDREERPDLDEIYMQATMMFTNGQGGWPMSVWLTPDLRPIFAGTYFPPQARWGRPGFADLCRQIGELWKNDRDRLLGNAQRVVEALREQPPRDADAPSVTLEHIDRVAAYLTRTFDAELGGIAGGGTNKFPPAMAMDLMLRAARRMDPGDAARCTILERVATTLDRMAAGGIHDQLAGGFCRYSTDERWLVPHFEKMLYDQALISRAYLDGYVALGRPEYADVARRVFDYVLADMQSPDGGFYSSRDADSEGKEGQYYVWTRVQIAAALGERDAALFCAYYDVSDAGNWSDPHEPGVVKNILNVPRDLETVAKQNGTGRDELARVVAEGRAQLLKVRAQRVPPHRDEKILVEWNGLMIATLARGGAVLGERRYVEAAARAAEFLLSRQQRDGRLCRSSRDGRVLPTAFLTDYAALIDGLIELYEATMERRWLERAVELNRRAVELFWDERDGGFFFTPHDHEALIVRQKDVRDSATPSGNALQLMNLLRLSVITGEAALRERAERSIRALSAGVLAGGGLSERFLCGVECALRGPIEIAIVGDPGRAETAALLRVVHGSYLPDRVLAFADPARPELAVDSPLLRGRGLVEGKPAVYVCRGYVCQRPATTVEALRGQLSGR